MTIVVVDPADIREDSELALLGLERMKGRRLEKMADKLFNGRDNRKGYFFFKPKNPYHYTRREIAQGLKAIMDGAEDALPRLHGRHYGDSLGGWDFDCEMAGFQGFMCAQVYPVVALIDAAKSLNAQELHVAAHTLKQFEEAYELGASPARTAE